MKNAAGIAISTFLINTVGWIAIGVAAAILISGVQAGDRSRDTEKARAYACGYQAGQRAILARVKIALPTFDHEYPKDADYCDHFRSVAAKHGFTLGE